MIVVTAGVHHAHFGPVVHRSHGALERKVDLLGDGERIHVGAEGDDRPRLPASQDADDPGAPDGSLHLEPERAQVLLHQRGGALLLERQLRVLVNVAPPGDDLGHHVDHACLDLAREWIGRRLALRKERGGEDEWCGQTGEREELTRSHGCSMAGRGREVATGNVSPTASEGKHGSDGARNSPALAASQLSLSRATGARRVSAKIRTPPLSDAHQLEAHDAARRPPRSSLEISDFSS